MSPSAIARRYQIDDLETLKVISDLMAFKHEEGLDRAAFSAQLSKLSIIKDEHQRAVVQQAVEQYVNSDDEQAALQARRDRAYQQAVGSCERCGKCVLMH